MTILKLLTLAEWLHMLWFSEFCLLNRSTFSLFLVGESSSKGDVIKSGEYWVQSCRKKHL